MRMALVLAAVMTMAAAPAALAAGNVAPPAKKQTVAPTDPGSSAAPKAAEPIDPVVKELRDPEQNPHIAKVEQKARELIAPLSQPQMQDLYLLREGYGLIRSVEIVQRDIGRAVRLCGEDNPDLKGPMEARFKKWTGTVDPVLKERMAALQKTIDLQTFTQPAKIRAYFKALDDAAVYADKKFDKRVVTTPDACKSLLQSMDGSQEQVAGIMSDLKVPYVAKAAPEEPAPDKKPE